MADLETLRPEVRDTLDWIEAEYPEASTIRTELLRLGDERYTAIAELQYHKQLLAVEAELAALRARIAASRLIEPCIQWPIPGYVGKRVRLLVDEPQDDNAKEGRSRE